MCSVIPKTAVSPSSYHKSVLVAEVISYMAPKADAVYVDATFGGGGHSRALLESEPTCRIIACDWDKGALELNAPVLEKEFPGRFDWMWGNFTQLPMLLRKKGISRVDGVLADFGTSQYQIFESAGFSFSRNTPLDMRMSTAHYPTTAADIIRRAPEEELVHIFEVFGEERFARRIAHAIIEQRRIKPIVTTADLTKVILSVVHYRPGSIHPATRVFQALRIAVNHELEHIETFLKHIPVIVTPGGRAVCISFHSLEDRSVKTFFRDNKTIFEVLTPKVIMPSETEVRLNPSSRSARLRAAIVKNPQN